MSKTLKSTIRQVTRIKLRCIGCNTDSWIPDDEVFTGDRRWECFNCGKPFVAGVFNDPHVMVWRDWHWVGNGEPRRSSFRFVEAK